MCSGRIQAVLEDEVGDVLRVGRLRREPTPWMMRQLKHRDRECQYPACGSGRFLHAHHIVWVECGGKTELENLILLCSFHHKLVHEFGWRVERRRDGTVQWFRPSGIRHQPGPAQAGDGAFEFSSFDWPPGEPVGPIDGIGLQEAVLGDPVPT